MKDLKFSLQNLKEEMAIAINQPIKVNLYGKIDIIDPKKINGEDNTYFLNNSIIFFWHEGVMYVVPYFRVVIEVLHQNDFNYQAQDIPFTQGTHLMDEDLNIRWKKILARSRKQKTLDFQSDCEVLSDEKGFKPISDELLSHCMEIPSYGIGLKRAHVERNFLPIITEQCFNSVTMNCLGRYNTNNDMCVFVYRNGNTYITNHSSVVDALAENGYKRGNLLVPLSFGEIITTPFYAKKWEDISAK